MNETYQQPNVIYLLPLLIYLIIAMLIIGYTKIREQRQEQWLWMPVFLVLYWAMMMVALNLITHGLEAHIILW